MEGGRSCKHLGTHGLGRWEWSGGGRPVRRDGGAVRAVAAAAAEQETCSAAAVLTTRVGGEECAVERAAGLGVVCGAAATDALLPWLDLLTWRLRNSRAQHWTLSNRTRRSKHIGIPRSGMGNGDAQAGCASTTTWQSDGDAVFCQVSDGDDQSRRRSSGLWHQSRKQAMCRTGNPILAHSRCQAGMERRGEGAGRGGDALS